MLLQSVEKYRMRHPFSDRRLRRRRPDLKGEDV